VQTFLPLTADFVETARSLDTRRLGKQRVETLQIVRIALVFTSCLTARPVDEIGENRSGSACAHAPASRYALVSSSFGFPHQ
jgi:pyrimidine dimer DNA glycosylase